MKLIVGLGNPGEKYAKTRHNVGFMVVEEILRQVQDDLGLENFRLVSKFQAEVTKSKSVILVKPVTFMNQSGKSVAATAQFYKIKEEDIYVVHDDLDIELGEYKLQLGKGPKVHYGVDSVEKTLGSKEFWRMRVGVENRQIRGNKGVPGEVYSLQNFSKDEEGIIKSVKEKVVAELISVVF